MRLLFLLAGPVLAGCQGGGSVSSAPSSTTKAREVAEATTQQVKEFCGACHPYPPPDTLPRSLWNEEVHRGFSFFEESKLLLPRPPLMGVVKYYEQRAPAALPPLPAFSQPDRNPFVFIRRGYRDPAMTPTPAVSNVRFVHLFDKQRLEILFTDQLRGEIWLLRPDDGSRFQLLSRDVPHPAKAEVVDLDQDGILDLLVADLGSFFPQDKRIGQVVWLRGKPDGTFEKHVLADQLGRVADVRAADFNGDGRLDLVVAAFGWQRVGDIRILENQTTDYRKPVFHSRVIDPRHGAIHVPIADLNGDGRPDFAALLSQEHESVAAYINNGKGGFTLETIFIGPHPAYGSSGIDLVDFDGDGKLDVLYTNGDSLDRTLLRPYHGIHLLMNRGRYPFEDHPLAPLYGVHRALAADFDGDGDQDIVAVSFLPEPGFTALRAEHKPDAIILLEQTSPLQFARHVLEMGACDHATCDVGDWNGDGRPDFVVGNFSLFGTLEDQKPPRVGDPSSADPLAVWINQTKFAGRKELPP